MPCGVEDCSGCRARRDELSARLSLHPLNDLFLGFVFVAAQR